MHTHHHHHEPEGATGNLRAAFFLNLAFTVIELIGGLLTNSVAILADAVHDAGDSLTLGLAWYLQKVSAKEHDDYYTYGYRRFSVLGAALAGLVLVFGTGYILWEAVPRLLNPQAVHAPGMAGLAVAGIFFNGLALWRARQGSSLNERVISWHLIEDVLGWAAVLAGSLVMMVVDAPIIDPLLSLGVASIILWNVIKNLRQVAKVFLQSTPEGFDYASFRAEVLGLPGVSSVHHVHTWSLDGDRHVLTAHVVVSPAASREAVVAIKEEVRRLVHDRGFEHITLDVEMEGEGCVSDLEA